MAAGGFVVVCTMTYRGLPEEWSQKYHVDSHPSDAAGWDALRGAFVTAFRATLGSNASVTRFYGYDDTEDSAVYVYDYLTHGGNLVGQFNMSTSSDNMAPGDAAAWVRWPTGRMNRGRKIYLRKYWHSVPAPQSASNADAVPANYQAVLTTFASAAYTTGWAGAKLAGPDGVVPTGYFVGPWLTTRTLKRRGKRTPT